MPDDAIARLGRHTWMTDELRERRKRAAELYAGGLELEALHETGKIKIRPRGERVLIRAILKDDGSDFSLDSYDARQSIAHEVVDVGPGVAKWEEEHGVGLNDRLKPGDHVFVLSAAADRASKVDKSVRLWLVHIEDVSASWSAPPG